ncbi:MAG: hypothetical protein WC781_02995 [Candidatus Pacearchaeota archaeon]|jgi:hypothetical protein
MKIAEIIQDVFGLIAIISFFAIFISAFIFGSSFYGLLFFTLFWLSIPVSYYMNKLTRNRKFNFINYLLMILMLLMGLVGLYFFITRML